MDFLPTADPLLRRPNLAYSRVLQVLGLDVRFESNSRYVIDLVEESFGAWHGPTEDTRTRGNDGVQGGHSQPTGGAVLVPALRVTLIVHDAKEPPESGARVRHISTGDGRLLIHSGGSVAVVDPARAEVLAFITTALAAEREQFRDAVLEAGTLALLASVDRHPLHAAAIERDGHAVLLAGVSGTGKSTLAYLASRSGMRVLGDDHVWVQLEPRLRIWGSGALRMRLLPDTVALFPELAGTDAATSLDARGKSAFRLDDASFTGARACGAATLCVIARGATASLERIDPIELRKALGSQLAPGFDRFADRHATVVQTLTASGGWRLTLSGDPFDALPLLERMLDEAGRPHRQ